MPSSNRGRTGLLALAAVLVSLLGACSSRSGPAAPGASVGQQQDAAVPTAVSQTVLVSTTGERLNLASLEGKVLVVSDVMTLCQETCPLDTANVVAAARTVDRAGLGNKIEFLSITIDPNRDNPAHLRAYRRLYAPAPTNWLVLTSTPRQLTSFWQDLGVYIQHVPDTPPAPHDWLTGQPLTYDLTHSDELFFLDTRGRERYLLEGAPHVTAGAPIPATLRRFLDATGQHNLTQPDPLAWTEPQLLQVLAWLTGRAFHIPS